MEKLNVYSKLQRARVKLQESNLKKSGQNKFSNYKYFELSDFLPTINKIMVEEGLFSHVEINSEIGILEVINSDNIDERIVFTIPSATMEMKGANNIQTIGAVQTYMRRYLYVNAFEIAENDIIDSTESSETRAKEEKKQSKLLGSKDESKSVSKLVTKKEDKPKTLAEVKKEILAKCKEFTDNGERDKAVEIVNEYNDGNPNPMTIKTLEVAQKILEALSE